MKEIIILILIFTFGCKDAKKVQREINNAKDISLHTIAGNPIEPELQDTKKTYLQDYEVQRSILLTDFQKKLLRESLVDSKNFSKDYIKRCPFIPIYGIEINNSLTATISVNPCSRIQFSQKMNGQIVVMDLTEDNKIEEIIKAVDPSNGLP